jgi:indolepyruvate ferredoxin oxidoreductase
MHDIAIRIYDLIQWGGVRYARRYAQRIRRVFLADDERHGFEATRAVVWNLAKLMLIKDEFYVAHLLTSFEKRRRDRQRYNVNPANGDRLRYRRTFHPRILGRRVDIRLPQWGLLMMRNFRFLRRAMPWYHRQDRRFLKWYEQVVDAFAFTDAVSYQQYVDALRCPESVTGYAEIRWPKMHAAQDRANQTLTDLRRAESARGKRLAV